MGSAVRQGPDDRDDLEGRARGQYFSIREAIVRSDSPFGREHASLPPDQITVIRPRKAILPHPECQAMCF